MPSSVRSPCFTPSSFGVFFFRSSGLAREEIIGRGIPHCEKGIVGVSVEEIERELKGRGSEIAGGKEALWAESKVRQMKHGHHRRMAQR